LRADQLELPDNARTSRSHTKRKYKHPEPKKFLAEIL